MSSGPSCPPSSVRAPVKLYLASSNPGKLVEFRALAGSAGLSAGMDLELPPWFDSLPAFDENEPTFAENALGKALHYSKGHDGFVFADDSGLVVPALGGAPGVKSARYGGAATTSWERNAKLLAELRGRTGPERAAHFVCVIALAKQGRAMAIVSDRVDGMILDAPRGEHGFGYDPVFYFPDLGKSFAELSQAEKNKHSHRGKAFRRLLELIR
jgi:XTP/dITP diphosphohydrolase